MLFHLSWWPGDAENMTRHPPLPFILRAIFNFFASKWQLSQGIYYLLRVLDFIQFNNYFFFFIQIILWPRRSNKILRSWRIKLSSKILDLKWFIETDVFKLEYKLTFLFRSCTVFHSIFMLQQLGLPPTPPSPSWGATRRRCSSSWRSSRFRTAARGRTSR